MEMIISSHYHDYSIKRREQSFTTSRYPHPSAINLLLSSLSTVRNITIERDGLHYVLPTIWDGREVDTQTAIRNSTNINIATGGTVSASNTGGGGSNMELIISYTNTISGSSVDAVTVNYRVEYYGSENVSFQGL